MPYRVTTGALLALAGCAWIPPDVHQRNLAADEPGVPEEGLLLWLRGETGVVTDPSTARVTGWRDQSGWEHDVASIDQQPDITADGIIGGRTALVVPDGAVLWRNDILGLGTAESRTLVAVYAHGGAPDSVSTPIGQRSDDVQQVIQLQANAFQTAGERFGATVAGVSMDGGVAVDKQVHVHVLEVMDLTEGAEPEGRLAYRVDGEATRLDPNLFEPVFQNLEDVSRTHIAPNGAIAEVLVYAGVLPPRRRAALEAHLVARYTHRDPDPTCLDPASYDPLVASAEGLPSDGLTLWLRGDVGVHVSEGADEVCRWDDQSPQLHDVVDADDDVRPTVGATLGGEPALRFAQGASLGRQDVLGFRERQARTIAAVWAVDEAALRGRNPVFIQGNPRSTEAFVGIEANTFASPTRPTPPNTGYRFGVYVGGWTADGQGVVDTAPHAHVLTVERMSRGASIAGTVAFWQDGVRQSLRRVDVGGTTTFGDLSGMTVSRLEPWGDLAEIVVYDKELTSEEVAELYSYFDSRYAFE